MIWRKDFSGVMVMLMSQSGDCDEEAFKEAVVEAAYSALTASSTTAP